MKIMGTVFSSIAFRVLRTTFFCCCHIYEDSDEQLLKWIGPARRRKDGRYLALTVKAIRAKAVPAGYVGIFDRDITMN